MIRNKDLYDIKTGLANPRLYIKYPEIIIITEFEGEDKKILNFSNMSEAEEELKKYSDVKELGVDFSDERKWYDPKDHSEYGRYYDELTISFNPSNSIFNNLNFIKLFPNLERLTIDTYEREVELDHDNYTIKLLIYRDYDRPLGKEGS